MTNLYNQVSKYLSPKDQTKLEKMIGRLNLIGCEVTPFGSRTIEQASHPRSDFDFLVYDPYDHKRDARYWLNRNGFEFGGSSLDSSKDPYSMINDSGMLNMVVFKDKKVYDGYKRANDLCVAYNIRNKENRIKVFDFMVEREGAIDGNEFTRLLEDEEKDIRSFSEVKGPKTSAMGKSSTSSEIPF